MLYSGFSYANHPFLVVLFIPRGHIYIFIFLFFDIILINHILAGLTQGCIEVPGGECHGMYLEATVSHSTKRG